MESRTNSVHIIQPASNDTTNSSESIAIPQEFFGAQVGPQFPGSTFFANSRNSFNPVSYTQMRFLSRLPLLKKATAKVEEAEKVKKKDDNGHKFLMGTMKNPTENDEDSQEAIEMQRAERVQFVQELMLASVQNENFQP